MRKHEPASDEISLGPGGLGLSLALGESLFVETQSGPLQIQAIGMDFDRVRLRVVGADAPVVRSGVIQQVLDGAPICQATDRGRALASFVATVVTAIRKVR